MLVLSRKLGERIQIGQDVTVSIVEVKGGRVRIGIEAPPSVAIFRTELGVFRNNTVPADLVTEDACL